MFVSVMFKIFFLILSGLLLNITIKNNDDTKTHDDFLFYIKSLSRLHIILMKMVMFYKK